MVTGLLQPTHLIIILVIVLIVFGAGKISTIGGAVGQSVKEFKESTHDLHAKKLDAPDGDPVAARTTASPMRVVDAGRADDL